MTMTIPASSLRDDTGDRTTEDRFNRKPFAQRLAQTIAHRSSTESFVIGLYGAWGEGKTTVLDYMDEALSATSNAVLVRFNPWLFRDDQALTAGLIATIGGAIEAQIKDKAVEAKSLRQNLLQYGGTLLEIVGTLADSNLAKTAGEQMQKAGEAVKPGEASLEKLKLAISAELVQVDRRVVILIDDIDRLTRTEIQQVFRLIKVAADFPTVTYVLAFDPDMVAAAVAAQYGSGDPIDGQRFLEKIVQLPLHLPHVDLPSITEYTAELLQQTLTQADINLTPDQETRITDVLSEDIMPAIATPRQAKRYANAVAFALPILRDETPRIGVDLNGKK